MSGPAPIPLINRFWTKVDKTDNCWNWVGQIHHTGYGVIYLSRAECKDPNRRLRLVHRVAYELLEGPIPEGLTLDHLCRNRRCVNPKHLEPVTVVENVMRGFSPNAIRARRTHCCKGHPLTGYNLIIKPFGYRNCRICHNLEAAKYRQRKTCNV